MIDKEKFFKYCKIVSVKEVSERLGVRNTAVYNWINDDRIPPIKWEIVNEFMIELEKNNKKLLNKRIKEYEMAMEKGEKFISKTKKRTRGKAKSAAEFK